MCAKPRGPPEPSTSATRGAAAACGSTKRGRRSGGTTSPREVAAGERQQEHAASAPQARSHRRSISARSFALPSISRGAFLVVHVDAARRCRRGGTRRDLARRGRAGAAGARRSGVALRSLASRLARRPRRAPALDLALLAELARRVPSSPVGSPAAIAAAAPGLDLRPGLALPSGGGVSEKCVTPFSSTHLYIVCAAGAPASGSSASNATRITARPTAA